MPMAFVTTSIHVLENSTSAASATARAPSTSADVLIPEGDCDCDGNQLDALGVCGSDCAADEDADGICDNVDPCVGELDSAASPAAWRHLRVRMFASRASTATATSLTPSVSAA